MTSVPLWLSKEFVLAAHQRLLAEFGGASGVRDHGLLESALDRPQNLLSYGKPSYFDLAAADAFGIVRNHPFVDGNKRTGFTAAAVFLETNGWRLESTEADATKATLALAAKEIDESQYAAWFEPNSRKADA